MSQSALTRCREAAPDSRTSDMTLETEAAYRHTHEESQQELMTKWRQEEGIQIQPQSSANEMDSRLFTKLENIRR